MMNTTPAKRRFNAKYHVLKRSDYMSRKPELEEKAEKAVYTGNPKHKKNPGDFGLVPPADPRPNANLCDNARIRDKSLAQDLLQDAFRLGLVDGRTPPGEWPKVVWMVYDGIVLQAMYENQPGQYHGFPLMDNEPVGREVQQAWKERR